MTFKSLWDSEAATSPVKSSIIRFVKGSRMTWFYGVWLHHKGAHWALWLGCPKEKVVRLFLLFQRSHVVRKDGVVWLAPVIPIGGRTVGSMLQHRHKARS